MRIADALKCNSRAMVQKFYSIRLVFTRGEWHTIRTSQAYHDFGPHYRIIEAWHTIEIRQWHVYTATINVPRPLYVYTLVDHMLLMRIADALKCNNRAMVQKFCSIRLVFTRGEWHTIKTSQAHHDFGPHYRIIEAWHTIEIRRWHVYTATINVPRPLYVYTLVDHMLLMRIADALKCNNRAIVQKFCMPSGLYSHACWQKRRHAIACNRMVAIAM